MDRRLRHRPLPRPTWDLYVASLRPYAWWQLDDNTLAVDGNNTIDDASGNGRTGTFNGDSTFPTRRTARLVNGSSFGVTTGNGANLGSGGHQAGMCNGSSWTFGPVIRGTASGAANFVRRRASFDGFSVFLNYASGNSSGAMSLYYDTGGTDGNSLGVTGTGWNNGNVHLPMFEYDLASDRLGIWMDGTKIGDRARAGTKPTLTTAVYDFGFISGSALANIEIDEYLFFNRVLTPTEHATLASYRI